MGRGIVAVEWNRDVDAKEYETALRDAVAGRFRRLELRAHIEKSGLEAGVTNLLHLVQHTKESIEASGIDGPRIRLRAQLDLGSGRGPRVRQGR